MKSAIKAITINTESKIVQVKGLRDTPFFVKICIWGLMKFNKDV